MAETVRVAIPLTSLHDLHDGAVYYQRSGHQTLVVSRRGDSVTVEGVGEGMRIRKSVVRKSTEKAEERADSLTEQATTADYRLETKPPDKKQWWWAAVGLVLVVAVVSVIDMAGLKHKRNK